MDALRTPCHQRHPLVHLSTPPPSPQHPTHTCTLFSSSPIVQSTSTTNRLWRLMRVQLNVLICIITERTGLLLSVWQTLVQSKFLQARCRGRQDRFTSRDCRCTWNRRTSPRCFSPHLHTLSPHCPLVPYPPSPIKASALCFVCYYGMHCIESNIQSCCWEIGEGAPKRDFHPSKCSWTDLNQCHSGTNYSKC